MLVVLSQKIRREYKSLKKLEITKYIYRNELDKACFQHDMTYGDFKDLARRVAADKVLRDKAFNFAKDPQYDGYQRNLAFMVYKFFDKETASGGGIKNEIKQNQQLAEDLHKPIQHSKTIFGVLF